MDDGIIVRILGDYGPFSRMGKSIGYQVIIGRSSYLIDCGSPLFQQIGGFGLGEVKGMVITHCHDDHKRWFTDLALFNRYAPDIDHRVMLLTSEDINDELIRSSGPALEKSLSDDSKSVVDIAYEEYVEHRTIGPRARYRIVSREEGAGKSGLYVVDREERVVEPDRAKIVISAKTKRPRMLFKDPEYGEWVEPESFYSYSSDIFYEPEKNGYCNEEEGFTIEAVKAPVWHGIPGIGIKVRTERESLVFSSDTVNDRELWKQLCSEKREPRRGMAERDFEAAAVLYGDINDYIERVWSGERYRDAVRAFDGAVVIHDIAIRNSVVHTDYRKLGNAVLSRERTILTHSPDRMTSEWVLSRAGKFFVIRGGSFSEKVGERLYPLNADVYHKEAGRYYAGYRNEEGKYTVYEKDGVLGIPLNGQEGEGTPLYRIDLYEDISGRYFPRLEGGNMTYSERGDGQVERVEYSAAGSRGEVVPDHRDRLSR
ncbi:MAG: hypothetical protein K8I29_12190 [Alphaproteobacteria bacterium]|uniref:MBL fold metallo-hydrolase n=1 Tax=Candidatus Nitrobium versatile TaxID=2884831 RepID=A0A953JE22_9BACT|nr:hypothetical protein [Candidatus Nitrobium versatile]